MTTTPADNRSSLRSEIKRALNRASAENGSDTPDHILADYLIACLDAFDATTHARSAWYGHHQQIGALTTEHPTPTTAGDAPDGVREEAS